MKTSMSFFSSQSWDLWLNLNTPPDLNRRLGKWCMRVWRCVCYENQLKPVDLFLTKLLSLFKHHQVVWWEKILLNLDCKFELSHLNTEPFAYLMTCKWLNIWSTQCILVNILCNMLCNIQLEPKSSTFFLICSAVSEGSVQPVWTEFTRKGFMILSKTIN